MNTLDQLWPNGRVYGTVSRYARKRDKLIRADAHPKMRLPPFGIPCMTAMVLAFVNDF